MSLPNVTNASDVLSVRNLLDANDGARIKVGAPWVAALRIQFRTPAAA